jgi:peroxiredoxin
VAFLAPAASSASNGTADVAGVLRQNGIRPVEPPSAAADLELPNLAGGQSALSEWSGRWVVLTFFAAWCGPCRTEMPTLQRLHEERGGAGLAVLGVSVDSERPAAEALVRELGLSFPTLWDSRGEAARVYRASSIPVSYLIDPQGRIAGVSRGARDWSRLGPMVDRLQGLIPAAEAGPSAYTADAGEVELSQVLDPPTATCELSEETPRVGKPFFLDVRIRWAGHLEDYLLHPPQIHLPDGIRREGMSAITSSEAGRSVVTYRVELFAEQAGSFALDPVELRYTPRLEDSPLTSRVSGPTVKVRPVTIAGLSPRVAALAGAVALLGAGASVGLARLRRKRRGAETASPAEQRYRRLQALFEEARKKRLEGDAAGFLQAMADLDQGLLEEEADTGEALEGLEHLLEGARYGGQKPAPEVMDRFERRAAHRLERQRPRHDEARRSALRLADDGRDE